MAVQQVDTIIEKIDFIRGRLARIDNIASALWFMASNLTLDSRQNFDYFRGAVEELSALQDEATDGVYDALYDVQFFVDASRPDE